MQMGFFGLEDGLFMQSPESRKFPSVMVTSDSFFLLHFIFIVAYEFTHSFINFPDIFKYDVIQSTRVILHQGM